MPETELRESLASIYEEVMWLARRPNVRPSAARAWYTHIAYLRVVRDVRRFTGKVSEAAVLDATAELQLEHFGRMQTALTQLVTRHLQADASDVDEFIATVTELEQVHIVTKPQNYAARKAKGDYKLAGISLLNWDEVPLERRQLMWWKVLRGRVANAQQFAC